MSLTMPQNGSYYIEEITHQFAENAWKLFLEIEKFWWFCRKSKIWKNC